jgi:uncharacterized protein (DUF983 family)
VKAREVGAGVLVSILFLALCDVLPWWAALFVVIPMMVILILAQVSEHQGRREVTPSRNVADG